MCSFRLSGEGGTGGDASEHDERTDERRAFETYLRTGRRPPPIAEYKFNSYHDPSNGQFTFGPGGGSGATSRGITRVAYPGPTRTAVRSAAGATSATGRQSVSYDAQIRRLGAAISAGEGNYESYNTGTDRVPGQRVGHSFINPPIGTVTRKTVDQILATKPLPGTDRRRMFAVGGYQITFPRLEAAKRRLHLTGKELMTPALQDRIYRETLVPSAVRRLLLEGNGSIDTTQLSLAKMWASIGVPRGMQTRNNSISDGYASYYGGNANKANRQSTDAVRSILLETLSKRK